ncbi:uncharacterized protein BCR38DRAFT_442392 [Pseudomassariella vexata]|uniref:Uncharacterized protein n=1 Tax=Pseudomassariella vexata TaxID=1141098 RepID=A0A1Y2DN83_9PEZI|nr:uncharacterized protein BCR38DRAFT_442392 [Pseudomassariella vexata]ORY60753.1 hypothetical protein BCR38DRAFT_442392 [Pseudomassariella vexata]
MEDQKTPPIALRRSSRRSNGGAALLSDSLACEQELSITVAKTPKSRSKKRVRFSDPGPEVEHHDPLTPSSTTGLTPMVRRSSVKATPSPKRRRYSTPVESQAHHYSEDELAGNGQHNTQRSSNEVRIFSLRQILDDRVKRRIRRNGLSEEMNTIAQDKRRRAQDHKAELQRLRAELAKKDDEIERLHESTMAQDTERIRDLERQVERLQRGLSNSSPTGDDAAVAAADQTQYFDWTMAARDPFSDSYMDDDEGFGDVTMAEFAGCSTPSRRARRSFPTPPLTSPPLPGTPSSQHRSRKSPQTPTSVPSSSSHIGVQASLTDPEKEALEAELGSLRLELTKLTDTLENHENLKSRIAAKLSAANTPADSEETPDVETHLDLVLRNLSDRTAALLHLNSSLSTLGFRGTDASEIISSLSSSFRSARLELEYLTPGEIALPLSSHGAEVLDLVLTRLRDLAKKTKEDESSIDEYHALELSLRQQLGARVEAMDGMGRELKENAVQLKEKDAKIEELEVGIERLKGAVEGYQRDIAELEGWVQRVDDETGQTVAQLEAEIAEGRQQVSTRDDSITELESRLSSVLTQMAELRIQLADLQARKTVEVTTLNKAHGNALALRDARVLELRGEIDGINASLRMAHETIRLLRVENGKLEEEREKAKSAVDAVKAELERVVRMSEGILGASPTKGPVTKRRSGSGSVEGTPQSGTYMAGALARTGTGKKKRRYDSGLGFLDEEEVDI